jgi:hypothetical protein
MFAIGIIIIINIRIIIKAIINISSPYVHVIKVFSMTAGYGISQDQGKDRTELKDHSDPPACRSSRPQPKKKKRRGRETG